MLEYLSKLVAKSTENHLWGEIDEGFIKVFRLACDLPEMMDLDELMIFSGTSELVLVICLGFTLGEVSFGFIVNSNERPLAI